MLCRKNKRGQIGETMTWMVATIVIIVILGASIFIVSSGYKGKKKIEISESKVDLLVTKSLSGYLAKENNFNDLKENGDFNEENCASIKEILDIYAGDYSLERLAGIHENDELINKENGCFKYNLLNYEGNIDLLGFWIYVNLDKNKELAVYLAGRGEFEADD